MSQKKLVQLLKCEKHLGRTEFKTAYPLSFYDKPIKLEILAQLAGLTINQVESGLFDLIKFGIAIKSDEGLTIVFPDDDSHFEKFIERERMRASKDKLYRIPQPR